MTDKEKVLQLSDNLIRLWEFILERQDRFSPEELILIKSFYEPLK